MDTSSLASVKEASDEYLRMMNEQGAALDMLFLNAGTLFTDMFAKCVPESEDGMEYVFQTNFVGHHLLYQSLEPLMLKSAMARVVSTSSAASFITYSYKVATDLATLNGCSEWPMVGLSPINFSYGQSKLAQLVWTKALTRRLGSESTIFVNAFHPGAVDTGIFLKALELGRASRWYCYLADWVQRDLMWSGRDGAHTGLFLGAQQDYLVRQKIRGNYYHPQGELVTNLMAEDEQLQNDLWEFSQELVRDFLPRQQSKRS